MNFESPALLAWLWLVPALFAAALWDARSRRAAMNRLFDAATLEKVFAPKAWRAEFFRRAWLRLAGIALLVLALAGPQLGQRFTEVKSRGSNVFILFDCSDSMLAEDFQPNRMAKAQRILSGLLERMQGNRVGIIAFAGEAYVYCPITFDLTAVRQFLRNLQPGMIPQPGTRIGSAIRLALSKLPPDSKSSAIILLTDGEDHKSDPVGAAEQAAKAGVPVFAIGVGSPDGEPIPQRDASGKIAGYKKNKKGEVVMSRMDEAALSQIAQKTGGAYLRASDSEQEIDVLAAQLERLADNPMTARRRLFENRYQWLLAPALLLLLLAESLALLPRKALGALVFAALFAPGLAEASFRSEMRKGGRAYDAKKYEEAAQHYDEAAKAKPGDPRAEFNRGAALYRLQQWEPARDAFDKSAAAKDPALASRALYNLGNAQFQAGQYGAAADAYKRSLRLDPSNEDAKFNLMLALQFKDQPPPKGGQKPQDQKQNEDRKQQQSSQAQEQQRERAENARRILKGAADADQKPVFAPQKKGDKDKKESDEDW